MPDYIRGSPNLFGTRPVVGFGSSELAVMVTTSEEAGKLVRAHHYSGSVVWSSNVHLGVLWRGRAIGAVQFGPAMNPASGGRIVAGTEPDEWLELNRMALGPGKPEHAASRVVAYSLRVLRALKPRVQWVQSFADERCGKLGAVYQACSFLYCGSHVGEFYQLDGEWFHRSAWGRTDKRGWGIGPKLTRFNERRHLAIKHAFRQFRYVKFLKASAKNRLLLPVLPYPKPTVEKDQRV